jgi:auxin efflux carrier family protein
MPVNVGLTFLIGGILGWILVKLLRPNLKVEGLIIAACSSGIVRDISKIFFWKVAFIE